jgi:hypothetical protein
MVEAKLLEDASALLGLMSGRGGTTPLPAPPAERPENCISSGELAELLHSTEAIEAQPAPALGENDRAEQLWVLADLARHGSGRARDRALQGLDHALGEARRERIDRASMERVVELLEAATRASDLPELYTVPLEAALGVLARQGG